MTPPKLIARRNFIKTGLIFVPSYAVALKAAENIKSVSGVTKANAKSIRGVAEANIKSMNGVDNTAGGGGGSFTFQQGATAANDAGTSAQPTVQLTSVAAGELIVYFAGYESAGSLTAVSDGTSSFTVAAENVHTLGEPFGRFAYLLSSVATGTVTYTPTFGGGCIIKRVIVCRISYTGSLALDTSDYTADGSGTSIASGAITTTAANAIAITCLKGYTALTLSSRQIGGSAATGIGTDLSDAGGFYRILTSIMTTGAGTVTASAGDRWVASIISFKAT